MSRRVAVAIAVSRWDGEADAEVASAAGAWRTAASAMVTAAAATGEVGRGEATPLPGYSPDRVDDCAAALAALAPPVLDLEAPIAPQVAAVSGAVPADLPAARFAIECALFDLAGQLLDQPAHRLLGAVDPDPVPLQTLVDDLAGARAAVARGVGTVKVKIGRDWPAELWLLRTIRAEHPALALRVDANRSLAAGDAPARLAELAELGIELCEEPVPTAALATLPPSPVPLAIDESAAELPDSALAELLARPDVGALIIKPTVAGGLLRAIELAALARARGAEVAVSHTFDGPVALAGACELALVVGSTACGLDRHRRLTAWPITDVAQLRARDVAPAGAGLAIAAPADPLSTIGAAREAPDRIALVAGDRELDYGELAERVIAAARGQRQRGAGPVIARPTRTAGDVAEILAALERQVPLLLIHPRSTDGERDRLAARAGEVPPDSALVLFTSGSTGRPKGVCLARAALLASAQASAANLGWQGDDRWLCCLPLAHIGGLSVLLRTVIARRTTVLVEEGAFDAAAVARAIERHRVTLASLVPTMLAALIDEVDWRSPPTLRALLLGGAAAPAALLDRAATRGVPVLTTYGMSEAGSQLCTAAPGRPATAADGCGRALPGVELEVAADGAIRVRGPMLMSGYLPGDPPAPIDSGGWLATGDRGYLDDDGRLHVTGRADDLIISGGENVDPREVERALEALAGVRAACAVGLTDDRWGQRVAALVVADRAVDPDELRGVLADYKLPRAILAVEQLPIGTSGKVDRDAARRMLV